MTSLGLLGMHPSPEWMFYNGVIVGEATVPLDSRTAGRSSFPWATGRLRVHEREVS